jgi:hypothetical protein
MSPEADFIEVMDLPPAQSSARMFYSFHPADECPRAKPLAMLFNGGPGFTTAFLMTLNTGPMALSPLDGTAELVPNRWSWTSFANLLYVDAREAGFSYDVPGPALGPSGGDESEEADGSRFVRVLLRFLARHSDLRDNPVVLVGESYGGMRTTHMLNDLLWYRETKDTALRDEIQAHYDATLGARGKPVSPEMAARQFGWQVLIEPLIAGRAQYDAQAALVPPTPEGRDGADVSRPSSWEADVERAVVQVCTTVETLEALWGVDPRTVTPLLPAARTNAVHPNGLPPESDGLTATLGTLTALDSYFTIWGSTFPYADSQLGPQFLRNLEYVRTFITNAADDRVIWSPAIPAALRTFDTVADVEVDGQGPAGSERGGQINVTYRDKSIGSRSIRFPYYSQSGHMVSAGQPAELAADIAAWLKTDSKAGKRPLAH